jgi:hypothetical protein
MWKAKQDSFVDACSEPEQVKMPTALFTIL